MNVKILYEPCLDYSTYLDRLAAFDGDGTMPVVGSRTPAMAMVENFCSEEPRRLTPMPGRVVVMHSGAPALRSLADALASCIGAEACAVEDTNHLVGLLTRYQPCDYVVYLGMGEDITDGHLMRLHDQLWDAAAANLGQVHLGVLTGRNFPELSWAIAKGLTFPWRNAATIDHVRIWPAVRELEDRIGTGEWILGDQASVSEVAPLLLGQHSGIVSFLGHGRDDVLHMRDTVICAAAPYARTESDLTRTLVPVCAFTGQCYRPDVAAEHIVRAGDISADVVLANSCLSWRATDGLFPQDYLLAYGFMSGTAAAYVGSPTILVGSALVNELFHHALAQGHSVGQAVSLVNDHLRAEHTDPPYFTLLGLPWITPGANLGWPQSSNKHFVTLPALPREEHAKRAKGSLTAVSLASAAVDQKGQSARPVYLTARTLPLMDAPAADSSLEQAAEALMKELRGLGRTIDAVMNMASLGFRYSRQNNLLVNLHDKITNLARALITAATAGEAAKISRRVASLREDVARAELTLAEVFFDRGTTSFASFGDIWGTLLGQSRLETDGEGCPYCGRLLQRRYAVHPLFDRIARSCFECNRCGVVLDRDPIGPIENMTLITQELWHHDQEACIALHITVSGALDRPVRAYAAAYTEAARRNQIHFPKVQTVSLLPAQTTVVDVAVVLPKTARTHQEFLRGFVVAEGTLNCAARPIWMRPVSGGPAHSVVNGSP